MRKTLAFFVGLAFSATLAKATVITFTGGTAYWNDHEEISWDPATSQFTTNSVAAGNGVTTASSTYRSVDYYIENDFIFDYIGGTGGSIGDYYNTANDVIHAHWGQGEMTSIEIRKVGGGNFEFNYFVLTSNTLTPGGAPTGFEDVHVQAWLAGVQVGSDVILPSEQWGFPAIDVYFGTDFDVVDTIKIISSHTSFSCFGMDEFYIDQLAPIPEPSAASLLVLGLAGLAIIRRRG